MNLEQLRKRLSTVSVNTVDLTPSYIDRSRTEKHLKELARRNEVKRKAHKYNYKDISKDIERRMPERKFTNPEALAVKLDGNSNPENQKMELIRMAKITALHNKDKTTNQPLASYDDARQNFTNQYSKKIIELRLMPVIEGIFDQFKDPSYKKKVMIMITWDKVHLNNIYHPYNQNVKRKP